MPALMALGVGPGEAVFVPSFTFAATAEAVVLVGATPVFVDCPPQTYDIDARSLDEAIAMIEKDAKLRPVGVIVVGMFGQPPDFNTIDPIVSRRGLWVIDDAAQSYGAVSFRPSRSDATATVAPFSPMTTNLRVLSARSSCTAKVSIITNVRIGMNGRLDTIQAAILIEKLKIFDEEVVLRGSVFKCYNADPKDVVAFR